MSEPTVRVDLKRSYGKGGRYYGPGKDVEVPLSLAAGLGLTGDARPASAPEPISEVSEDEKPAPAKKRGKKASE